MILWNGKWWLNHQVHLTETRTNWLTDYITKSPCKTCKTSSHQFRLKFTGMTPSRLGWALHSSASRWNSWVPGVVESPALPVKGAAIGALSPCWKRSKTEKRWTCQGRMTDRTLVYQFRVELPKESLWIGKVAFRLKLRVADMARNQNQTLKTNIWIRRHHLWLCFREYIGDKSQPWNYTTVFCDMPK